MKREFVSVNLGVSLVKFRPEGRKVLVDITLFGYIIGFWPAPCRLDNSVPARAGLNAVADPRGRNLQAGTVF